ncbi:MAG: hypothetical protein JWO58_1339 [Chitinophagaceae bacterium]|nr:hypothetical protein [Chitinophagaceae bacterium]
MKCIMTQGVFYRLFLNSFFLMLLFFASWIQAIAQVYSCGKNRFQPCGPDLVVNGNFGDLTCPPTTFTTEFIVECAPDPTLFTQTSGPRYVHLTKSAYLWNYPWYGIDHTGDGSGLLIADADSTEDLVMWSQDVTVSAGELYYFSLYATDLALPKWEPPRFEFSIGGFETFEYDIPKQIWRHVCTVWTAPVSGIITLKITLGKGQYFGYDGGLDDIVFQKVCVLPPCPFTVDGDKTICQNDTITLHAAGGLTYKWSPDYGLSNTHSPTPVANPLRTQLYTVDITDANGCFETDTITVVVNPLPAVLLAEKTLLCSGEEIELSLSEPGVTYQWNNGSLANNIFVGQAGSYSVQCNRGNCKVTSSTSVSIYDCCKLSFVPDLITPNSDGKNDVFHIECINDYPWKFSVYNKWGNEVYMNSNYKNEWNAWGLNDGVYFFRLEKEGNATYEGWVQVTR